MNRRDAEALDRRDPLAPFRRRFELPAGLIYLDGNSLGALPRHTPGRLQEVVRRQWGETLIHAWSRHGWLDLPRLTGGKIARLIGAEAGEVVVTDSTSVNLFKLLAAALALRPGRKVILSEPDEFPTDLYMMQGLEALLGGACELRLATDAPGALDPDVAVLALSHVHYTTGALRDMAAVTAAAHRAGALVLWDLSHSAGALEIDLAACRADLAVGCGYKYLNGGPGAPGFLYVARRHQEAAPNPLAGWLGHAEPFAFEAAYRPAAGIDRFLCGTPPILSLAALDAGLDLALEADPAAVRRKSMALGELFLRRVGERCAGLGLRLACPPEARARGSQVSLRHPRAGAAIEALAARGVIADLRGTDVLRFGLAPLYVRYVDVWDAVEALRQVLATAGGDQRGPRG